MSDAPAPEPDAAAPEPPSPPSYPSYSSSATSPAIATRRKPALIIGAAVVAVGFVGGAVALANAATDDPPQTVTQIEAPGIVPFPDPSSGPAPAPPPDPVPIPGPQPDPPVTFSPTTTTIPESDPPPTDTDPGVEITGSITVGDVTVGIPAGWTVRLVDDGYVALTTDGAEFRVILRTLEATEDAQDLLNHYVTDILSQEVQDLQTGVTIGELPSASIVSAAVLGYEGILASNQGTVPVDGFALGYVRQDGLGVVLETFNRAGEGPHHDDAYQAMIASVIASL